MKSRQQGFTMIELIVVIVILGILAATALPKFIDMRSDAEVSALSGVAGGMASAMATNYAGCSVVNNVVTANKCAKVSNCTDVSGLMLAGLPAGYTVAASAVGAGTAGANGETATCAVAQTSTTTSANFIGISAGL